MHSKNDYKSIRLKNQLTKCMQFCYTVTIQNICIMHFSSDEEIYNSTMQRYINLCHSAIEGVSIRVEVTARADDIILNSGKSELFVQI